MSTILKAGCKKHIEKYEKDLQEINDDWKGSKPEIINKEMLIAGIKLFKIVILLCTNIENIKQLDDKKRIFPLLLSKYDNLLNELYDLKREMVEINALKEEDYRLFCEKTLGMRNLVKKICDAGQDTEDNYEIVDRMVLPN